MSFLYVFLGLVFFFNMGHFKKNTFAVFVGSFLWPTELVDGN